MFLNKRDLDIRCIRMVPHNLPDGTLLLDVQQTIPLPETKDFIIDGEEKDKELRRAISGNITRDFSRYAFLGTEYGKGRLVQAVVAAYLKDNPETTYEKLAEIFPRPLQGSLGVFTNFADHAQRLQLDPIARYFGSSDEILKTGDGQEVVVCSQWGRGNIDRFIEWAKRLGFNISKAGE